MIWYSFVVGFVSLPLLALAIPSFPAPVSVHRQQIESPDDSFVQDVQLAPANYPAHNFSTPIDHFHNDSLYEPHSEGFYNMRFWFDAQYYKEGGPVIVLAGGETSGSNRFAFLQKGILAQLAKATNGIGVILEHRYYGKSWPVPDLSVENLRFLTTDQALADTAYFAQNIKFPGLEDIDLTSKTTPYIAYGGSYAGAFVAFLRKLYPDVYFGAISSSGVTEAIYDYWQYFEAARIYGPPAAIEATQKIINVADNILLGKNGTEYVSRLKQVYGLGNVSNNADFANQLTAGIGALQSYNWDPTQSSNSFFRYCDIVGNSSVVYPRTESLRSSVQELIVAGGWGNETETLTNHFLNHIGYVNATAVANCRGNQDECFGLSDPEFYSQFDITQTWRSWPYQVCTQWGYLQTGSGVPEGQLTLVSRLVDLPYSAQMCVEAFNITTPSNIEAINKYGGFNLSYSRLAFIDGEWDPWRAATPHALGLTERTDTIDQPFRLIAGGVHHWDENGLFANETTANLPPPAVKEVQEYEAEFVQGWLKEWKAETSVGHDDVQQSRHKLVMQP